MVQLKHFLLTCLGADMKNETCHKHCFNGGTCVVRYNGTGCLCPIGFDGARCQDLGRFFKNTFPVWCLGYAFMVMLYVSYRCVRFINSEYGQHSLYRTLRGPPKKFEIANVRFFELAGPFRPSVALQRSLQRHCSRYLSQGHSGLAGLAMQ